MKRQTGRPSSFTQATADAICERMASGFSLRKVCAMPDMPALSTVMKWLNENDLFSEQYARARDVLLQHWADQILDIADTAQEGIIVTDKGNGLVETKKADMIEHRRLQVDSRKWLLSKLAPKKYGDKLDLNHGGGVKVMKMDQDDAEL